MKIGAFKRGLQVCVLQAAFSASSAVFAYAVDHMVVLGDSLSDIGNLYAATEGGLPRDPPYWQGRSSNGPLWSELLAADLGAPLTSFAITGATTGTYNVWDGDAIWGLHPNAPYGGLQDQVADYIGGGVDPAALHFLWAGGNNFTSIPADPVAAVTQGVTDIVTAVGTLRAAGAANLRLINLPDLGLSPRLIEQGLSAQGSALSDGFNAALVGALQTAGLGDVPLFDVTGLLREVVSDPEQYGLTNVTEACFKLSSPAASCFLNPALDQDEYLFWDDIHPSRVTHAILAGEIRASLGPVAVPEPDAGALLVLGVLGIVAARWTAFRGAGGRRDQVRWSRGRRGASAPTGQVS